MADPTFIPLDQVSPPTAGFVPLSAVSHPVDQPEASTTAPGLAASFARGAAPYAVGAGVGAAIGGPPGAAAGVLLTGGAQTVLGLYRHARWPDGMATRGNSAGRHGSSAHSSWDQTTLDWGGTGVGSGWGWCRRRWQRSGGSRHVGGNGGHPGTQERPGIDLARAGTASRVGWAARRWCADCCRNGRRTNRPTRCQFPRRPVPIWRRRSE